MPGRSLKIRKFKLVRLASWDKKRLAAFALVFSGLGGYWLLASSLAVLPPPTVYLTPESRILLPNSDFSVEVRMNSGTTPVNAVQANFNYPAHLVQFVSIDTANSAFPVEAPSGGASGNVTIARGITGSLTGDQLVAVVHFRTLGSSASFAGIGFTDETALMHASTNQDILGSTARASGVSYKIDGQPPVTSITTPAHAAAVAADSTVAISATASDAISGVSRTEILIDGLVAVSRTAPPYDYNWNTAGLALGSTHTIQSRATDGIGNVGLSAIHSVTIADRTAPTVVISTPAANAHVRQVVTVAATATDNPGGSGISRVELYVGGVLAATDTASPFSFNWDSRTVADGSRQLTVRAYDNAVPANVGTSAAITVRVDNTPPTTPANLQASAVTASSVTLGWGGSLDSVGVTGYRILNNGTTLTTAPAAARTFTVTGLSPGVTYTLSVAAVDAAGNLSAPASLTVQTASNKRGDINGDNQVNITDLSILLSNWGRAHAPSDLNGDGTAGITDLSILLSNWGR